MRKTHAHLLGIVVFLVACSTDSQPEASRFAYVSTATDSDRVIIYMGSPNVLANRDVIESGGKLEEQWTRIELSRRDFDAATTLDLGQTSGITIDHGFQATDPYVSEQQLLKWFRMHIDSGASTTTGRLVIARDPSGEPSAIMLDAHFEGMSFVWEGPEPVHVTFDIQTGFPVN